MHPSLPIDCIAGISMTHDNCSSNSSARVAEVCLVMEMIDTVFAQQDR